MTVTLKDFASRADCWRDPPLSATLNFGTTGQSWLSGARESPLYVGGENGRLELLFNISAWRTHRIYQEVAD